MIGTRAAGSAERGALRSSTMMVMMIAKTPSLKASNRPLLMQAAPTRAHGQDRLYNVTAYASRKRKEIALKNGGPGMRMGDSTPRAPVTWAGLREASRMFAYLWPYRRKFVLAQVC